MTSIKIQKLTLRTCFVILFIFILLLQLSSFGVKGIQSGIDNNSKIALTSSFGIVIDDANITYYSSSGIGSQDDPYIIENLIVDTTDSLGIKFNYVTSYFILRDSYAKGSTYGVYLSGVSEGRSQIINCTIEGGLSLGGINSHYMTVYNCTLRAGQGSSFSRGLNFTKNIMEIKGPASSSLLHLTDENNIIEDNTFIGDSSAVRISDARNSSFRNNIFEGAGFRIYENKVMDILNNTYENNIVNGKPFGFFYNRSDETITGNQYGQIYIINSDNIDFEGYEMGYVNVGIQVQKCTDISIKNVNVTGDDGIEARTGEGLIIEECHLYGDGNGIQVREVNNTVIRNNYLEQFRYAMQCDIMDDVQIHNNTVYNATEIGVNFEDVNNILMTFNIISCFVQSEGSQMSLVFGVCENVTVYYNIFISLGDLMAHPVEEWTVTNIMWYNDVLEVGNHYSDWNGMGTYSLTGDGGSVDLYPFIDIDGDDLTEFEEVIVYFTDPFNADSDSDGLDDGEEVNTYETDPLSDDSDSDGMDDLWEVTYGTDPNSDDADEDPDEDGLTNGEEYNHNTLPMNNDTDGDGYLDGEEVDAGTDPLNSSSFPIVGGNPYLGLIIGLASGFGAAAGIGTYILIRKRKTKASSKKGKK
ncbi:MAG: right-handed parallel beta-helix repeat-containing protein [Candidatus Heimdallarchaeota archaeon]|nr:right-handed parallel beta-helix repeat-containing protein [Candidatus Heimdallarchaeota archaeon]MCK4768822.1 right-handed parallel beta-helix repeat-containing protein [Candidatus Heimdallarchaeota archaeon]